jgi:hypothetical protein
MMVLVLVTLIKCHRVPTIQEVLRHMGSELGRGVNVRYPRIRVSM